MACCGKRRENILQEIPAKTHSANNSGATAQPLVYFEYTGDTGLTAIGSVTHNHYRFQGKGDQQAVDYRDASGMLAVPMLRKVKAM